jgi:hypothetical protein
MEVISGPIYFDNPADHINILCGQNVKLLTVAAKEIDIGTGYCSSVTQFSPNILLSDFDRNIFNIFIEFYKFLTIPQNVLKKQEL